MPEQRKVVYLLGAGASNAVIKYYDRANQSISMADIADDVLTQLEKEADASLKELCDILWSEEEKKYPNVDIESIITLYESSGTAKDRHRTNKLRNLFRVAINQRIEKASGMRNGSPDMITALVDMYSLPNYNEELCAILTINYDNFVENAMINNYGGINIPFEAISVDNKIAVVNNGPMLCKLHGSFNWENTNPVKIDDSLLASKDDEDKILWIPPGVIKRSDHYPFNAIWGTARFCLKCDVLRIIGCSLNTNDFTVISLLHTTNRLREDKEQKYEIQFIGRPKAFQDASRRFPYLNMHSIIDIPEFIEYVRTEYSIEYKEENGNTELEKIKTWLNKRTTNIFELWLKAVADNLMKKGVDIERTQNGFLQRFCREV